MRLQHIEYRMSQERLPILSKQPQLDPIETIIDPFSRGALDVVLVQSFLVVGLMIVDGCDRVVAEYSILRDERCYRRL